MGLLTISDVAVELNVSVSTVRSLIGRRDIPVVKVGDRVRIKPEALDAYVRTHTIGGVTR